MPFLDERRIRTRSAPNWHCRRIMRSIADDQEIVTVSKPSARGRTCVRNSAGNESTASAGSVATPMKIGLHHPPDPVYSVLFTSLTREADRSQGSGRAAAQNRCGGVTTSGSRPTEAAA